MLKVKIERTLPGFKLDVDFVLEHGVMAILGASGAGKTMTLECIAGLLQPDAGQIELNGRMLYDSNKGTNLPPQQRKVGFVFQNYALFPHLTVIENVTYGIRHLPRPQIQQKVSELLELMHITALGERFPSQLSAGQQQRVAIARSLAPEPEILLFDEPFSALDLQLKERLELEFLALQQHFKGEILIVTHDLAEGYKLGNKVAVFQSGSIIQCGSKHSVFFSPANNTVARLTGIRNLMKGRIKDVDGDDVSVFIPAWGQTLLARKLPETCVELGQGVSVGIRSDHVKLNADSPTNALKCHVLQVAEGISSTSYRLQVESDHEGAHLLNANIRKGVRACLEEGQTCEVCLPVEHIIIING